MALRLHEIHPSIVHFPLTLVPAALIMDVIGRATGRKGLMDAAKYLMPAAAVSGVVTGMAGLAAQQAVRAEGRAHELLATHRNLNVALVGLTGVLAAMRMRQQRPGWLYMLLGLGGVAAMNYTAYLGGKMVYSQGVGVESAHGVDLPHTPELRRGSFGESIRMFGSHVIHGLTRAAREIGQGEIAPTLRGQRFMGGGLHRQWRATDPSVTGRSDAPETQNWMSHHSGRVTGTGVTPGKGDAEAGDPF